MSLRQILSSTLLLSSSLLARADYGYGSSGSSSSVDSSGSGGYGSGSSGGYGSSSSSNGGYGSGSGSGSHGNQGYQSSSTMDSGMRGKGGMEDSHSTTYGQNTQIETISVTETMMMTMTVTESVCSTQAMATYSPPMGGGPPTMSGSGGSWGSSGSSTSISVQIVTVSDNTGALSYFPDSVVAEVGSIVEFHYYPKNHTVTQSSFAAPCVPINVSTPNMTTPGIKSGFVPVAANATDFMKGIRASFSVMINDTKPIWIYCGQVGHCQKGMSMVINQNMTDTVKTLVNYQAAAAMLPIVNGSMPMPMPPPGSGGAPPEQSTSTSTFTAAAFPPPSAPTQPPPVVTQQPPSPVTTSAAPVAQLTSTAPSVGTFTGAAVALNSNKLSAAAGVIAMGVAALL